MHFFTWKQDVRPPICDKTAPPHLENPGSATDICDLDLLKQTGEFPKISNCTQYAHHITLGL